MRCRAPSEAGDGRQQIKPRRGNSTTRSCVLVLTPHASAGCYLCTVNCPWPSAPHLLVSMWGVIRQTAACCRPTAKLLSVWLGRSPLLAASPLESPLRARRHGVGARWAGIQPFGDSMPTRTGFWHVQCFLSFSLPSFLCAALPLLKMYSTLNAAHGAATAISMTHVTVSPFTLLFAGCSRPGETSKGQRPLQPLG